MKKHFIIDFLAVSLVSAAVFTGCGKTANTYCIVGVDKIESGDYQGAVDLLSNVVSKNANFRDAYRELGIAYYEMGNLQSAMEAFKTVIDKSGNTRDDIYVDTLKYYADCLASSGDYEDAIADYTEILQYCSKDDKADFYYLRGCAYIHLNDENNATLDFEKSLEYKSDDYSVYCNMYNAFLEAGFKDRAESYLKRLINADNVDDFMIGKTYFVFKEYDLAEQYLKSAVDEGESDANYYLAMTYEAQERYSEAEDIFQTCISKNPNDAVIYNQYGAYLINRKDYENALAYIETGLDIAKDKTKQALLYNQAVCYEYTGDYAKAYELFSSYVSNYPDDKNAQRECTFLETRQ